MIFKIFNSDFGIKYNGGNYSFTHVASMTIEDPSNVKLVRGSNATNKEGLVFTEGLKDPFKITVTIIGMSAALKNVLDSAYSAKDRMDVYCIDRGDGSIKMAKNAVLCQKPQQLSIEESAESLNVVLIFESFDLEETHKS